MSQITVQDLTYAYGDGHRALDGLSLSIEPGEVVGLLGRNGAGKTTLIHVLLGLLEPAAGQVRLFDLDPREWPAKYADHIRKRLELIAAANDLHGMAGRTEQLAVDVCARGLAAAGDFLDKAANGFETLCTDPSQAAQNLCDNLDSGLDRVTAKAEGLWNDPLGCPRKITTRLPSATAMSWMESPSRNPTSSP